MAKARNSIFVRERGSDYDVELCTVGDNPEAVMAALHAKRMTLGKSRQVKKYEAVRVVDNHADQQRENIHMNDNEDPRLEEIAQVKAVLEAVLVGVSRPPTRGDFEAIRQVGMRLNEIGGIVLMKRILSEVGAKYEDPEYGRMMSICDHAWNGVGDWLA
jgi:hypothetical protein